MAYEAALVTLELATFSIEEGRTAEVKDLAREIVEIFRTRDRPGRSAVGDAPAGATTLV